MGRISRRALVEENSVNHCTWRSHNLEFVLHSDEEKAHFRELLRATKRRYGILIASYSLMDSHPHVVCVSPRGQEAFSAFWRVVNQRYARWFNRRHRRRGQVVMERLKSPRIQDEDHLLRAMRYGDLNPVRAGLVQSPKEWKWSSYRHYAFGDPDDLVDDVSAYVNLGRTAPERRLAYQHLFATSLDEFLRRRRDLVDVPFIGNPDWVESRVAALRGQSGGVPSG